MLVLIAASLAYLPLLNWQDPSLKHTDNPSLLEARSLLRGTITLPERAHDTALHRGEPVNVFQPGQTLFFLLQLAALGERALDVFQVQIFLLFTLSTVLLGLALLDLSKGRLVVSVSLAVSAMLGAPYIATLRLMMVGSVYRVNHCLSALFVIGLLVLIGRRSSNEEGLFLIGACIGAAMLFRGQNVLLLGLPLSFLLQSSDGTAWRIREALATPTARKELVGPVARLALCPILAIVIIAGFQTARFNDPFETGYAAIYEGRSDYLADRAHRHGLFSLHFLPENLDRTLFAFPGFEFDGWRITRIIADPRGNSLLMSQPILLLGLCLWRSVKHARAQSFLLTSLMLAIPVWMYHNPGFYAPGYMRLSLDYLFLWIATLAVLVGYGKRSRVLQWGMCVAAGLALLYGGALLNVELSVKSLSVLLGCRIADRRSVVGTRTGG
jgi:hypothetical protein